MTDTTITDAPTITRDEAIHLVVGGLSRYTVEQGAELAQLLGAEVAAELTLTQLERNLEAFAILGISEDDIRRVSHQLDEDNDI